MVEKIYLASILLFFILAFAIKNIKTSLSTGLSIKGKSKKLSFSILLSTFIYLVIFFRLTVLSGETLRELDLSYFQIIKYFAYCLVTLGFIIGLLALVAMKNSWRVGIKHEQKTNLVTYGIYKYSRNPYFLSYYLLILGFILLFPSIFLLIAYLTLVFTFHTMILDEEKYLEKMQGKKYLKYKNRVNRYFTFNGGNMPDIN